MRTLVLVYVGNLTQRSILIKNMDDDIFEDINPDTADIFEPLKTVMSTRPDIPDEFRKAAEKFLDVYNSNLLKKPNPEDYFS